MENKINGLDLINCLLYLKIISKKMDKISIIKCLEINNKLKELETENTDGIVARKSKVPYIKKQILGRPNSIEEDIVLKKQTRNRSRGMAI